jgi:NADH:ubiquinone reductase (non-electrogenic)
MAGPSESSEKDDQILKDLKLLGEKALDTVEDAILHLRRYFSPYYRLEQKTWEMTQHEEKRPKLVVVGSGWSAHALLKIIEAEKYHVICVSPRSFFIFTPMLSSTAVGTVEYRSIIEPIRVSNSYVDYIEGEVREIDPLKSELTISTCLQKGDSIFLTSYDNRGSAGQFTLKYDYLMYAAGAQVADYGTPGVRKHCCFIKEIEDVKKIKNSIINTFELASLPNTPSTALTSLLTFVVVGGGPTGVEFAGGNIIPVLQLMTEKY